MEVSYGVVYVAPASLVNHLALRGETDTWWPPPRDSADYLLANEALAPSHSLSLPSGNPLMIVAAKVQDSVH